jgi:metal-responsive CopG/Arc/MetJ family transcriptional regulator
MRENVSVSLPEDLKAELDRWTSREHASRSDIVRRALSEYLFVRRYRALREEILPYGERAGVFTDDEVFDRVS